MLGNGQRPMWVANDKVTIPNYIDRSRSSSRQSSISSHRSRQSSISSRRSSTSKGTSKSDVESGDDNGPVFKLPKVRHGFIHHWPPGLLIVCPQRKEAVKSKGKKTKVLVVLISHCVATNTYD